MLKHTLNRQPILPWVLVADGKTAQIYQLERATRTISMKSSHKHPNFEERHGYELVQIEGGALEAEQYSDYQAGHDKQGTVTSLRSSRNTYSAHEDIRDEIRRHFVEKIVMKLEDALHCKQFNQLILVAPAKMIGALREKLPEQLQDKITAVLSKDLTSYRGSALLEHLQDTLIEARII